MPFFFCLPVRYLISPTLFLLLHLLFHCCLLRRLHTVNACGLLSSGIPGGHPFCAGRRRRILGEYHRSAIRDGTFTWSPQPGITCSSRNN